MNMELFCNGTKIINATWADIEAVLPELKGEAYFDLSIIPQPKSGPNGLEIQSEDGNYLPVLGYAKEAKLRGLGNPAGVGKEMVQIRGYEYDPASVTQDFDLIVRMIKEFYETGDVSKELL